MADRELSDTGDADTMAEIEAFGDTSGTVNVRKAFSDTTLVDWNVSNTNITINVNVGFRHTGALYAETGYRLEQTSGASYHQVSGTTANITWEYVTFISSGTHLQIAIGQLGSGTVTYKSCIAACTRTTGNTAQFYSQSGTTNYYDCMGFTRAFGPTFGVFHRFNSGTVNCYRCTGWRNATSTDAVFLGATASFTCYACIAGGSAAGIVGYSASQSGDYNISKNADTVGANSWNSVDVAAILNNVTSGSEDFTVPAANYASFTSTYVTPDYSVTAGTADIVGATRVSTGLTTPGCDMCVPAAPTVDATPAPNASYTVGGAYSVDHAFTGTGTITADISAGAVPSGTSITGATGVVAGTLTTAEAVSYTVRGTDAWGQTGTREFTTEVVEPPDGGHGIHGPGRGFNVFRYGFRIGSGRKGLA